MQEDWVEEECHRVEAQLALKEARQEIQQLKHAVETVRTRLSDAGGLNGDVGIQKYFQDINTQNHKLENLLVSMELAQAGLAKEEEAIPGCRTRAGGSAPASVSGESPGVVPKLTVGGRGSCSCDGSPARSLTRSSTYTKLSDQALGDRNCNDAHFPCLSGERLAPFRCSLGGVSCMSHPCLSHHHLYLHPLREAGIQTESCPIPATAGYPSDLDTIAEQRTFRSQACSPTSTWMSDEGEEDLDSITTTTSVTTATVMTTATEPIPVCKTPLVPPLPRSATVAFSMESPLCQANDKFMEEEKQEKEKREKADSPTEEQLENTTIGQSEEEQQRVESSVEWTEVRDEKAQQSNICDLAEISTRMQSEINFAACCGDGNQKEMLIKNQRVEDKQQEAGTSEISTREKTTEISPGYSIYPGVQKPQTSQPPRRSISHEEIAGVTVVEVHDEDNDEDKTNGQEATGGSPAEEEDSSGSGKIQKSYWSRHFLVDLLAVAIPVVPTVAWLCRGPVRDGQPMYHFGSLLRGCCTVALHSLRRGGGLRHYPAGGGDLGGSQI
ncbi:hypothetical protein XENOCAPTIV_020841 [Xenoophorus captivus]|uniref:Syntaphilin b n=1 Tax=Xenoophorus captivus TaxID=1517983 RepID=A0ABV0RLE1_9TELE